MNISVKSGTENLDWEAFKTSKGGFMTTESSTGNYFDEVAESWDDDPIRIELAGSISDNIIKHVPLNNQMAAMEFGCGTGLVSMFLARNLKKIIAVDSSEKMLETLNRKAEHFKCRNILTLEIDPEEFNLPFNDEFDFVFSSMVFHHIKNTDKLLNMLCDSMHSKGYLAVADLDKEDGSFHEDIPVDVHHFGFKREDLMKKIKNAGFSYVDDLTAYVFSKKNREGVEIDYPIFLLVAQKE